ncbi:MAG: carboxypeptidase regulatory-like domain-containing protein [Candidatus Cloacimonetes bacterium]|nr:carboxypeptidase regulatory-like domain-containing protein [Candidatus Cloacimonadota bacterium]
MKFILIFLLLITCTLYLIADEANTTRDPWDLLLQFELNDSSGETGMSGLEWDGAYFYTTKWRNSDSIFQFDGEGNYIDSYTIPVTGVRDLAFDGVYMYGSAAASTVYCWNPLTGAEVEELRIELPGHIVRGLAYDPLTDSFWSGNWNDALLNWDREGNIINTILLPGGLYFYGLAFDPGDETGSCIYGFSQSEICEIVKIAVISGEIIESVDVTEYGGEGAIAGGLCFMDNWDPAFSTLGALFQGAPDIACVIELYPNAPEETPGFPQNFTVTADPIGELSAELSWINPAETTGGELLTDLDEMRLFRDDELIYIDDNPLIGVLGSYSDNVESAGFYEYTILGYNDAGEGLSAAQYVYIGEDVPGAVNEFCLENEAGNSHLSWENPVAGLHGYTWMGSIDGYHLLRSDGVMLELNGIMTDYLDTAIPVDDYYSYTIQPYNQVGNGGYAITDSIWISNDVNVLIGNPNTVLCDDNVPFDIWHKASLSEVLYYENEILAGGIGGGALTSLHYQNLFLEEAEDIEINIWIGETTNTSLSEGWIPSTELELVYHGLIDFPVGRNDIFIVLDEPFFYEGGNLVIMTERPYSSDWAYDDPDFLYTEYPDLPVRCLKCHAMHENEIFPENPPADHYSWNLAPNTTLCFNTEDLGTLVGYARSSDNNMPLENIHIQIIDTNNETFTQEDGFYSFPELLAGIYTLEAEGIGYFSDQQTVEIAADEITEQNFYLEPIDQVTVNGHIAGSDQPETGLAGAEIQMQGLGIHIGYSDENGNFSMPTLYVNNTYQLYVILQGYEILTDEVVITTENIDLGDLLLTEIQYPVSDVTAWQNDEDTVMNLVWSSPTSDGSRFWDFEENDGGFEETLTWEWGIDDEVGSHSGEKVWGTALNENYAGNSHGVIVSPEVRILTDDTILSFWHWYHLEENYDGGNVKISTDNGANWSIISPVGGYPELSLWNNHNTMPNEPAYNGSCDEWLLATFELGEFLGETVRIKYQFGSDLLHCYEGWFIDDVYIGSAANNQRLIESYNISRLLFEDEQIPGNWETIATAWTDTTYIDPTWENADSDIYKYAVEAIYSNNIFSEPAFSNYVARDFHTTAAVSVFDQNTNPVTDAWVRFFCEEEGPDGEPIIYEQYSDESGEVYFPLLWQGTYDILVFAENMEIYQNNSILINTPYTLSLTLADNLNPVENVGYNIISNNVTLSWESPSNQIFYDFEADNAGFTGEYEWEWANGCNQGNAHSGENCWSLSPDDNYPVNANTSLYTPSFLIPTDDTQLTFYHYYDIEMFDGCNLKISTDNGSSWDVIRPVGDYPYDSSSSWNYALLGEPCWNRYSYGWVQEIFELGEFRGEEVMFRFHFGSDDGACSAGWDIDDFRIGRPSGGERIFECYNVYRDSVLLATELLQPEFTDTDLEDGTYTYGISAVYSAGESEISEVTIDVFPLDVSGFITLSDMEGNPPAEGVAVSLQNGYFNWETTTNADGLFCFENINGNQTCNIRAEYENYYIWSEELQVGDEDIHFDLIILNRIIYPTFDVTATVNEADTECYLNWNEPETWNEYEIIYDDDDAETATGWYDATNERAVWFTSQGGPCMVTGGSINIYDGSWPSGDILTPFTAAVWEYNSDTGLPGDMLGSVQVTPDNYFWVDFEFENPVLIEGSEFFLGYIQDSDFPDCIVIAVDESYPTVNRSFRHWITGGEPWMLNPYYQDFMIRAIVAGPNGEAVRLDHQIPEASFATSFPAGTACSSTPHPVTSHTQTGVANYRQISDNERDLAGYNIIRGEYEDTNNWSDWDALNTEPVTGLSYTDTEWADLELETNYAYGVIAVYSNNNLTVPAFSNWIARDAFATLQVNFTTNTGDLPAGANITLTASSPDPDGNYPVYTAITDENGHSSISWIRKGNYELEAELTGFALLIDQIDILEDEVLYEGMITEILYPPYHLSAEENHAGNMFLNWHSPADFVNLFYDFEGNDPEFTGDTGWVWGNTSNSGEPPSEYNCWSTFPGEYYLPRSYIALYSPPVTIHSIDTQLIFQHWYDIQVYWAGANVKVSSDDGLTWQVIVPFGGYPQEAAYSGNEAVSNQPTFDGNSGGWISSVFSLADYHNQEIIIKFHLGTSHFSEPYMGWDIDNVFVGIPDNPERSLSLFTERSENRRERLDGYHIFRGLAEEQSNYEDWQLIASSLIDTVYEDISWQNVTEPGEYMYCVRAGYAGGVLSNPSFSDTLNFSIFVPVTIYVTCNSGESANGAQVALTGHDGVHNYDATVNNGYVNWDEVRKGMYHISILKTGFEPWQDPEYRLILPTIMNVELIEIPYPPANVEFDYETAMLSWDIPDTGAVLSSQKNYCKIPAPDRYLSYYNIYLNEELYGQTADLQYLLSDLIAGESYIAGVSAFYSSNVESEIIEILIYPEASDPNEIPKFNYLYQNYPNPFNPETTFTFSVCRDKTPVSINIYNVRGQLVKKLEDDLYDAGRHQVTWNAATQANGIFFCCCKIAEQSFNHKILLLK